MAVISDYMSRHHRDCDDAFARAEEAVAAASNWSDAERYAGTFLREMERHIGMEENVLFPAFEEATGMDGGPTAMMRMEHEQMRDLFVGMRAAIATKNADEYAGLSETFLVLLQQHNMKEESMLYPMLDQALGNDAGELLARIEQMAA